MAQAIAQTLTESGVPVDVCRMQDVRDITSYGAVIAGSAIHAGQWLPEAMRFVRAHQADLSRKPFAAFIVCMTLAMPNPYREHVASWLEPVRALVRPVSEGFFAGTLELKRIPSKSDRFKFWLSVKLGVWKEGDHRDWKAIHAWALGLVPLLHAP